MYFDESGDYLSIPDSEDWNLEGEDFTIDGWVNLKSLSTDVRFASNIESLKGWGFRYYDGNIDFSFYQESGAWVNTIRQPWSPALNQWIRFCFFLGGFWS